MSAPFPIAVCGTRFLQLALATLLAKRGKKVLVIDPSPKAGGDEASALTSFRRRPSPLFGLDSGGLLRRFLDEIGIGQILVKKAYPPNPVSFQVVLPRHRLDIHPDREALMAEIAREFPASADAMRTLYRNLDAASERWARGTADLSAIERLRFSASRMSSEFKGWWMSRGLTAQVQQASRAGGVADFLAIQHHFLGGHPGAALPSELSAALVHGIGRRGTFQETLGTASLTALMATRFQEFGGQILRKASVRSVDCRNREHVVINLSTGAAVSARCLALTDDLAAGLEGLPPFRRGQDGPAPSLVPLRFFIGLDERYVPVGMGDDVFFLRDDDGGPMGTRMLYLALSPAGAPSATAGQRSLTVTALVPPAILTDRPPDWVDAAGQDLTRALESVIPFLSEGIRSIQSDIPELSRERTPRPLGGGLTTWDPGRVGRRRIRRLGRGRFLILSPAPWELGLEGDALIALAAAGTAARSLE